MPATARLLNTKFARTRRERLLDKRAAGAGCACALWRCLDSHEVEMLAQAFKAIVQEQAIEQQAALAALRAELRFEVAKSPPTARPAPRARSG